MANHNGVFTCGYETAQYSYYNAETKDKDLAMVGIWRKQLKAISFYYTAAVITQRVLTQRLKSGKHWLSLLLIRNYSSIRLRLPGFAKGVEEDAQGLRIFAKYNKEILVASSFSKNFGLYNERVGAFTLVAESADVAATAFSQVKAIIRSIYSNPPAHGSAVVTHILNNPALRAEWEAEVKEMRDRIQDMRELFVATLKEQGVDADFSFIERQNGMFSFSGLSKEQVNRLKDEFAIYIVGSGRISVAGMTRANMLPLCKGIAAVL